MSKPITITDRAAIRALLVGSKARQVCALGLWSEATRDSSTKWLSTRYYDGAKRPIEERKLPKRLQLELIGMESDDRLDQAICPRDAISMYEFDEEAELFRNFYEPSKIDAINGVYIMDTAEKQRLEKKQIELYAGGERSVPEREP